MIKKIKIHENKAFKKLSKGFGEGFTLIEILVVIGIISVLAAVVLVAINPSRQFKLARDSQRLSNVTAILNAISQNIAENKGVFDCSVVLSNTKMNMSSNTSSLDVDIASCIVPTYISSLPFDPSKSGAKFTDTANYDTQYSVEEDTFGRITVSAVGEINSDISVTR